MKIVIDIPKKIYDDIKSKNEHGMIFNAVKNGTPLPEHHGRLGDLDALEKYFKGVREQLKASDYKNGIEFFVRDEMLLNFQQFIHLCDAIIEGSDNNAKESTK